MMYSIQSDGGTVKLNAMGDQSRVEIRFRHLEGAVSLMDARDLYQSLGVVLTEHRGSGK